MRRTGVAGGLLVTWALAGVLASIAWGAISGATLAAAGGLPMLALALVLLGVDLQGPSRVLSGLAAASATLALAFAVAGHVLHWEGLHLRFFLLTEAPLVRYGGYAAVLLFVPLYAGARLRALELAWRASGSRARGPALVVEAIAREDDLLGDVPWRRAWRGALLRWTEGAAVPGLLVLDFALGARRPADRLHAEADAPALAAALAGAGAGAEARGRELLVRLAEGDGARVSVSRNLIPPGATLEIRGHVREARRLRHVIETDASHAILFTWSAPAQRWERRLNALAQEARIASTLEERSLVMEELDRVRLALADRALAGEESSVLALKEAHARGLLAHRMLSEAPGAPIGSRVLAQHAAMMPDVARVLDAGGLSSVKRVAFVPHWIVPVQTRWGEQEAVVSAATGRLDVEESRALLDAMRRRGPVLLLDVGAHSLFLPAPRPTGALLREMREGGLAVADEVATGGTPVDIVYVPYLATSEGYVSGVTGRVAPELGAAVPVAPA